MLDERRGLFFAHIPKTGGSSIEAAHGFESSTDVKLRHKNEKQLASYLESNANPPTIRFRFVVVRNIVDRLVSTYRHRHRVLEKRGIASTLSFEAYLHAISDYLQGVGFHLSPGGYVFRSPENVAATGEFLFDLRHIERFDWWVGSARNDYDVLRFERLDADYRAKVAPCSGIKLLPHRNPTPERYRSIDVDVTPAARRLIARCYKDEIETFSMPI